MRSTASVSLLLWTLLWTLLAAGGGFLPPICRAQSAADQEAVGSLVAVSLDVDGARALLYPGPGGRYYLEARPGAEYDVRVANRTSGRLGVSLVVDGLDAISGDRRDGGRLSNRSRPGRMYVLEPWDRMDVRGWRTSLEDVSRFTFVAESVSYAARSGKANSKMGWIEVLVYRERDRPLAVDGEPDRVTPPAGRAGGDPSARARAPSADASAAERPSPAAQSGAPNAAGATERKPTFPGTGWGPRSFDPAIVVDFEPERQPAERITLRYEYRKALIALGVLPRPWNVAERLAERERGGRGFAELPPPLARD